MRKAFTTCLLFSMLLPMTVTAQSDTYIQDDDTLATATHFSGGSADKVTQERMNKGLVTNSLSALSGQAAGVQVSNGANRMAMLSSVRVRGTTSITGGNDPLVIIDGVSADLSVLSSIYPADIESFTILKNAAETAQYGSRGASGVIQVTTKKGHGGKFHISYDGNYGFESVYKNIEMLGRDSYVNTAQSLGLLYNDGGHDTDFPDAITRTGTVHGHHVAFGGGSDLPRFYLMLKASPRPPENHWPRIERIKPSPENPKRDMHVAGTASGNAVAPSAARGRHSAPYCTEAEYVRLR